MKETTYTINIPNEPTPTERRKERAKKKRKKRLFFVLILVGLFVLSFAITWATLSIKHLISIKRVEVSEPPETETTEKIEVSAPAPVTDPRLPTIIENKEPTEEPTEEEPSEEVPSDEEPSDEPDEEEPTEKEPSKEPEEEDPTEDGSRGDGLR